jgi:uncharacterized protein with beta-barrel porin domain
MANRIAKFASAIFVSLLAGAPITIITSSFAHAAGDCQTETGQYGFTPYAAAQVQSFRTPSYSETALSGSSIFALSYDARTITTTRTELGTWLDWSIPVDYNTRLSLLGRAAWAHDFWSAPNITAGFLALPGSSFVVTGAAPATDLLIASAGVEVGFRNGFSVGARFDGEFAEHSQKYSGIGRLVILGESNSRSAASFWRWNRYNLRRARSSEQRRLL